jgi:hypothetical protein
MSRRGKKRSRSWRCALAVLLVGAYGKPEISAQASAGAVTSGTSNQQTPVVIFTSPGVKTVTLTVCNERGCSTVSKQLVVLDPKPAVQSVTTAPNPAYAGALVTLTAAATGQPPLALTWTISGVPDVLSGSPAVWDTTGLAPGVYSIEVVACNLVSCVTGAGGVILHDPRPAVQWVTAMPNPAVIGQAVALTAGATGRPPLVYQWRVSGVPGTLTGNPATWNTANAAPGAHTVTVTVSNGLRSATASADFTLKQGLLADFRPICPLGICLFQPGQSVQFSLTAAAPISLYEYDWTGQGAFTQSATSPVTSHVYPQPGVFIPEVRAHGAGGLIDIRQTAIPVAVSQGTGGGGGRFFTVTPCRVVDTRRPPGALGAPALSAGVARTFNTLGVCGIPAAAKALAVNVTVTNPMQAGFIVLWAAGTAQPPTSTINFRAGQVRANNAVVSLGPLGGFNAEASLAGGSVQFILDVSGYFD